MARNEKAAGGVNCAEGSQRRRICFLTAVGHHKSPSIAQALTLLGERRLTGATDIAIVSPGAWRVENATHHVGIVAELVRLLERAPSHLPRVVYMEPLAAHFETADGWWQPAMREPVRCAPLREGRRRAPPHAHQAAAALLGAARVPASRMAVIDGVWEWTSALTGVEHPGVVLGKPTDCTHYCLWSGVSDALLDAIAAHLNGPWAVRQQAGYHRRLQGGFRVPGEAQQPIPRLPTTKEEPSSSPSGGGHGGWCGPPTAARGVLKLCSAFCAAHPVGHSCSGSRCGCDASPCCCNGDVPRSSRKACERQMGLGEGMPPWVGGWPPAKGQLDRYPTACRCSAAEPLLRPREAGAQASTPRTQSPDVADAADAAARGIRDQRAAYHKWQEAHNAEHSGGAPPPGYIEVPRYRPLHVRAKGGGGGGGGRRVGKNKTEPTIDALAAPLLGLLPASTSNVPRTARFAVTRGGKNRSEWLEVDDAAGWPSRSVPRPRTSPPAHALALCVFGVPGVEHGKAALQQKLSPRAVFAAAESHITQVLQPAEAMGWTTRVFAHSWGGEGTKLSAAVDEAYGERLGGSLHERFGLYTTERVTSMLISITTVLRLARSHAARVLRTPFALLLVARHDVYFFRPLELSSVDPNAFTTAPWCEWKFGGGGSQAGGQAGGQAGSQAGGQAGSQAGGQAGGQAGSQAGSQAEGAAAKGTTLYQGQHCGTLMSAEEDAEGVIDLWFLGGQIILEHVFSSMTLARMMKYQRGYAAGRDVDRLESPDQRTKGQLSHRHTSMAHFVIQGHLKALGLKARGIARLHPTAVPYVTFGLYREREVEANLTHLLPAGATELASPLPYRQVCNGQWLCRRKFDGVREQQTRARWDGIAADFERRWERAHPPRPSSVITAKTDAARRRGHLRHINSTDGRGNATNGSWLDAADEEQRSGSAERLRKRVARRRKRQDRTQATRSLSPPNTTQTLRSATLGADGAEALPWGTPNHPCEAHRTVKLRRDCIRKSMCRTGTPQIRRELGCQN